MTISPAPRASVIGHLGELAAPPNAPFASESRQYFSIFSTGSSMIASIAMKIELSGRKTRGSIIVFAKAFPPDAGVGYETGLLDVLRAVDVAQVSHARVGHGCGKS